MINSIQYLNVFQRTQNSPHFPPGGKGGIEKVDFLNTKNDYFALNSPRGDGGNAEMGGKTYKNWGIQ